MKNVIVFSLIIVFAFTIVGCLKQEWNSNDVYPSDADRSYVLENGGLGGNFIITLNSDGTYHYREGSLSSYFGTGVWIIEGDTLCLNENIKLGYPLNNWFKLEEDAIVFLSEKSTNFIYVKLPNNARFKMCVDES